MERSKVIDECVKDVCKCWAHYVDYDKDAVLSRDNIRKELDRILPVDISTKKWDLRNKFLSS